MDQGLVTRWDQSQLGNPAWGRGGNPREQGSPTPKHGLLRPSLTSSTPGTHLSSFTRRVPVGDGTGSPAREVGARAWTLSGKHRSEWRGSRQTTQPPLQMPRLGGPGEAGLWRVPEPE